MARHAPPRRLTFLLICEIASSLLVTSPLFAAGPYGYADVEKLIRSGNVSSVETFLEALPEDIRASFIFVVDTRSTRQVATEANPRVILSNKDRSLILTFAGEEKPALVEGKSAIAKARTQGGKTVEVIHVDPTSLEFRFKVLDFSKNKPNIVEAPKVCVSCHRGRPIWDTYPFWAGVIGERREPMERFTEREIELVRNIQAKSKKNRRYGALIFNEFKAIADGTRVLGPGEYDSGQFYQMEDNLVHFSNEIQGRRMDLALREFDRHPAAGRYRQVFEYVARRNALDRTTSSFNPEIERDTFLAMLREVDPTATLEELQGRTARIEGRVRHYQRLAATRERFRTGGVGHEHSSQQKAAMEMITERMRIAGPKDWSFTLEKETYALGSPFYGVDGLVEAMKRVAASCKRYLTPNSSGASEL